MRVLWIILIVLLTAYAPLELTRIIIIYPDYGLWSEYHAELCIFWAMWVVAIIITSKRLR